MKKTIIIVLAIIAIIFLANALGYFSDFNYSVNNLVAGEPNRYCNVDADCQLKSTSCAGCDCGEAVNKDWSSFCPFRDNKLYRCKLCPKQGNDFQIECSNNQCVKMVWFE